MLVRVGNLYGIFKRINALFMAFKVPHGSGFDIHTICPCFGARCENLGFQFLSGLMQFCVE